MNTVYVLLFYGALGCYRLWPPQYTTLNLYHKFHMSWFNIS